MRHLRGEEHGDDQSQHATALSCIVAHDEHGTRAAPNTHTKTTGGRQCSIKVLS